MFFTQKPENFESEMDVVGCYVNSHGKLLFLLRHPAKVQGNTWCVPGGKVDTGETLVSAAKRELREESGIVVEENQLSHFQTVYKITEAGQFYFHMFLLRLSSLPEVTLSPTEHTTFTWADPQNLPTPLISDEEDYTKMFVSPLL